MHAVIDLTTGNSAHGNRVNFNEMNSIQVDINHLKKGEVSLGTSMYVSLAIKAFTCIPSTNILTVWR